MQITVDVRKFTRQLDDVAKRQIPFAMANALNRTADEIQDAMRMRLFQKFTINASSAKFMASLIYRGRRGDRAYRATKRSLVARISVGNPDKSIKSPGRAKILSRHEEGGTQTMKGGRPFFIPTDHIRGGHYDVPAKRYYPKALGLEPSAYLTGSKGVGRAKGSKRRGTRRSYFVIDPRASGGNPNSWGIYERRGKDIRMIWAFRRTIQLGRGRLGFYDTSQRVTAQRMRVNFDGMLAHAMRTARR